MSANVELKFSLEKYREIVTEIFTPLLDVAWSLGTGPKIENLVEPKNLEKICSISLRHGVGKNQKRQRSDRGSGR